MVSTQQPEVTEKKTVLVVDDETVLLTLISAYLKKSGYHVLTASSGNKGYNVLLENHIDLLLSDVRMPDGDGVELLKRTKEYNAEIPVIIHTGYADESEEELYRLGAAAVFPKPTSINAIKEKVDSLLGITTSQFALTRIRFDRINCISPV